MPVYRYTLYTGYKGFGDTETYWTGNISAPAAATAINTLMQARVAFALRDTSIDGLRIAEDNGQRHSQLLVPGSSWWTDAKTTIYLPQNGAYVLTGPNNPASQWRQVIQSRLNFGVNQKAIRYYSGFPRNAVGTEPGGLQKQNNLAWWAAMTNFEGVLASGGYFLKTVAKPTNPLVWQPTGIYSGITGFQDLALGFNVNTFPTVQVGQRVHVYGFRPAKGTRAPTLNGTWYVSATSTSLITGSYLVFLRNSKGIDAALQRFTDKSYLFPVAYSYSQISYITALRVGIRKRGKAGLVPRGRRLTRASLDP